MPPNQIPANAAEAPPIQFKSRTLPNGLKVFWSLDRSTPNVTVQVWYGVGSKDDPQGRSGFAHLFEHLMFQGSENLEKLAHFRHVQGAGGARRKPDSHSTLKRATACATMASPRPTASNPSLVFALRLTRARSMPSAPAIAVRMSSM